MSAQTIQNYNRNTIIAISIVTLLAVLRLVFLNYTFVDLAPDEAQYWLWSKYPDLSYYSKGPLVAWLLTISTFVFGDTILGVKFFAVIGVSIISWLAFILARNWRGDKAGFYAIGLLNATPLLGIGGLLMVPDVPVAVLWLFALWLLTTENSFFAGWKRFIIIGFVIGIAGLAKYTAGLFYPLVGIYFLVNKKRRIWLKKPHIYVSGLISLACLLPIFIWNINNDFVGLKHVLGQVGGEGGTIWQNTLSNFIGGQAGMAGGLVFIFLIAYWLLGIFEKNIDTGKIFWWFSAPLFAFFCIKAFGAKVQPNWPVLSILVGFIGLSGWIVMRKKWIQIVFIIALVVSGIITFLAHDTNMLRYLGINLPIKNDPLKPALGWHGLGEEITKIMQTLPKDTVILTTRYQTASEFAFYIKNKNNERPEVLYINPGYRRQNQFDYWVWPNIKTKTVLYINEADTLEQVVNSGFEKCSIIKRIKSKRKNPAGEDLILKTASIYLCENYIGLNRIKYNKY